MNLGLHPLALAGATLSLGAHFAVFGVLFANNSDTNDVAVHLVDIKIAADQTITQQPLENPVARVDAVPPKTPTPEPVVAAPAQPAVSVTGAPISIEITSAPTAPSVALKSVTPPTVGAAPRSKPATQTTEVASLGESSDISATNAPESSSPGASIGVRIAPGSNEQPRYPLAARKRGYEGQTIIRAQIGLSGEVLGTRIVQSSGHKILDTAASKAVTGWQFRPATRDGQAVTGQIEVPIEFRLQ